MKRKREEKSHETVNRPLYRKEELLTVTIELALNYNRIFQQEYSDLTLYNHAELITDINRLLEYNKYLYSINASATYVEQSKIINKFHI